jgi:hypothetical protein
MVNDENDKESVSDQLRDTDIGRRGHADRATTASPTNELGRGPHWSVVELTYPHAQRFSKQEEPRREKAPIANALASGSSS